jgi:small subunit ribosomal protein S20
MANIKSAKKRISVIERKTQRNRRVKSHLKEILKDFEAALAAEDKKTARDKLALAEKRLMQAASKGTIHRNAASRKVSRITTAFINAFGKEALLEKADMPVIPDKPAPKEAKPAKEAKAEKTAKSDVAEDVTEEAETETPAEADAKPKAKSTKKASAEEAEAPAEEVPAEEPEAPAEETPAEEPEAPVEAAPAGSGSAARSGNRRSVNSPVTPIMRENDSRVIV